MTIFPIRWSSATRHLPTIRPPQPAAGRSCRVCAFGIFILTPSPVLPNLPLRLPNILNVGMASFVSFTRGDNSELAQIHRGEKKAADPVPAVWKNSGATPL